MLSGKAIKHTLPVLHLALDWIRVPGVEFLMLDWIICCIRLTTVLSMCTKYLEYKHPLADCLTYEHFTLHVTLAYPSS